MVATAPSGSTTALAAATPASHVKVTPARSIVSQTTLSSAASGDSEGAGDGDAGTDGVATGVAAALGVGAPGCDGGGFVGTGEHAADSRARAATIPMIRFTSSPPFELAGRNPTRPMLGGRPVDVKVLVAVPIPDDPAWSVAGASGVTRDEFGGAVDQGVVARRARPALDGAVVVSRQVHEPIVFCIGVARKVFDRRLHSAGDSGTRTTCAGFRCLRSGG